MNTYHQPPATVCAENIAISYLLGEVHSEPLRNPENPACHDNSRYQFPLKKERNLTEILSFLAKTTDGHEHIPALCIEQYPQATHLSVLLAVNKSTWHDGNDILCRLQKDFNGIFKILKESQYECASFNVEKTIFAAIVAMCSSRILHRLRLRKSKDKKNKSIKENLQRAKASLIRINSNTLRISNLKATYSAFMQASRKVEQLVDAWSKHHYPPRICDLVNGIHELNQVQYFAELIALIPNADMSPSQRESLTNMVKKVARYREAARVLYRLAKKYPLVRNMHVELANLPREAFDRIIDTSYQPSLQALRSRIGLVGGKKLDITRLEQTCKSEQRALNNDFSQKAHEALRDSKIHAEVQIIAFCDLRAPSLYPRVISSSKDACFLCNMLIGLHGKMHTFRSHGRLYHRWRLPHLIQFKLLQQQFNQRLLDYVRQVLHTGSLAKRPLPNESTVLTLSCSATTRSSILLQVSTEIKQEGNDLLQQGGSIRGPHGSREALSATKQAEIGNCPISSSSILSIDSIDTEYILNPGTARACTSRPGNTSPFFVAKSLAIQVEIDFPLLATTSRSIGYSIEWIRPGNIQPCSSQELVVAVERLCGETIYTLPEQRAIYIALNDVMLRVALHQPSAERPW